MKIKQPNPITVVNHVEYVSGPIRVKKIITPIKLIPSKDPKRIKELKVIREWLDRAIQWGEQE